MSDNEAEKTPSATELAGRLESRVSCSICFHSEQPEYMRSLPIYVSGSEGVVLCSVCQLAVTDYLRALRSAAGRGRLALKIEQHRAANAKLSGGPTPNDNGEKPWPTRLTRKPPT